MSIYKLGVFILGLSFVIQAQIKVFAPDYKGSMIYLYEKKSPFLPEITVLDSLPLTADSIIFNYSATAFQKLGVQVDQYYAEFFYEGKYTEVLLQGFNELEYQRFAPTEIMAFILNDDADGMNYFYNQYLINEEAFYEDNYNLIAYILDPGAASLSAKERQFFLDHKIAPIQHLVGEYQKMLGDSTKWSERQKDWMKFAMANFELSLGKGKKYLYEKYLKGLRDIDIYNPEMVYFFEQFFHRFHKTVQFSKNRRALYDIINNNGAIKQIDILLEDYDYFEEKNIKKWFILNNLTEIYHSDDEVIAYRIENLMLQMLADEFSLAWKNIINTYISYNFRLEKYKKMPELILQDQYHDDATLQAEGKHKYIMFWDDDCNTCLSEMMAVKQLYENYNKAIDFMMVYLGEDSLYYEKVMSMTSAMRFPKVKANEYTYYLKRYFKLYKVPEYIFLSPDNELLAYPALGPIPDVNMKSIDEPMYKIFVLQYPNKSIKNRPDRVWNK